MGVHYSLWVPVGHRTINFSTVLGKGKILLIFTSSYHAEHVPCLKMAFLYTLLAAAVVGLERTFNQVSEDVGVVEVCAVVYSPEIACPIAFPFDVRLRTLDGSAGKERDKNHN